ncbi:MAG: hypothetical protein K0R33_4484 [Mycobacterium sp.]|nr:hypothetical protein [Mycobacterium sp.]
MMVTVADIPSGPDNWAPMSPEPPCIDQPSGTATVITGATESATLATMATGGRSPGAQVTVPAGIGVVLVGTTPKSG